MLLAENVALTVEVRRITEADLEDFAAGRLDRQMFESVEAYLLDHPEAEARVEVYRQRIIARLARRRLSN